MKPVFISPNIKQTREVQAILRQAGIDVSVIEKKNTATSSQANWCELWLKNGSDSERADSIITQYEFNVLKQLLSTTRVQSSTPEPPVASKENQRKSMEQAHLPINNQRVFRRLAHLLGFTEKEAEQADVNKLYRPWSNKSLMERVEILQQMCISTGQTAPDDKRH